MALWYQSQSVKDGFSEGVNDELMSTEGFNNNEGGGSRCLVAGVSSRCLVAGVSSRYLVAGVSSRYLVAGVSSRYLVAGMSSR